jgi:phospholipase C
MLIITFDEHGGFYDHQPPPHAIPPADASPYANPNYTFRFDRLGVRVPAVVVSAYTPKGTVIGTDPKDASTVFDHTSVLATVEKRFALSPLTKRDEGANTLDVALTSPSARDADAPTALPDPAPDSTVSGPADLSKIFAADPRAPLSTNQKAMAALALACDLATTSPSVHAAVISNHQKLVEQADAADYIKTVEEKIVSRRSTSSSP